MLASCTLLQGFLQNSHHIDAAALNNQLVKISPEDTDAIIALYKEAIPLIEQSLWSDEPNESLMDVYQQVFREMETHIAAGGDDNRHHIVLFIPVADRPQHLTACLYSLLELCRLFNYGGFKNNRYQKVSVIICDDSRDEANIRQHKNIVEQFATEGLETTYFGQQEQLQQIAKLSAENQQRLSGVLGKTDPAAFYHKGSPRMRNIAYLKLHDMLQEHDRVIFYSLDSDQEFQIKTSTHQGDMDLYAINYFYYLDEIFSRTDACILTGKVVGDPPVSPAVMAGNFLQDVTSFVGQMAILKHQQACQFHSHVKQKTDDAAYHDMAELFGFKRAAQSYHYPCPVKGKHDNGQCFNHLASQLNGFFYGEHPTRKTYYEYAEISKSIAPARTVYPGNYMFNAEGLKYFIPFAPLKLRMNGPVMGRIIKAELKDRFVSANLPMLHKRTVQDTGQSEFRPDIHQQATQIDLSGEFERQYFGDVMLFSMEKLTEQGYPAKVLSRETVSETVNVTEQNIQQQYLTKHQEILNKLERFKSLLNDKQNWWNQSSDFDAARAQLSAFADNIEHNFGDDSYCYRLINSVADKQQRLTQIIRAIMQYPDDQLAWEQFLAQSHAVAGMV